MLKTKLPPNPTEASEVSNRLPMGALFDEFMERIQSQSVNQAFESFFGQVLGTKKIILWLPDNENEHLFSPTNELIVSIHRGILGYVVQHNALQTMAVQSSHASFSAEVDAVKFSPDDSVFIFPISTREGSVKAVVQAARDGGVNFSDEASTFIQYFMKKCKSYIRYIFEPPPLYSTALDLITQDTLSKCTAKIINIFQTFFNTSCCEIYSYQYETYTLYTPTEQKVIDSNEMGIVGHALKERKIINERIARSNRHYLSSIDHFEGPILVIPYVDQNHPPLIRNPFNNTIQNYQNPKPPKKPKNLKDQKPNQNHSNSSPHSYHNKTNKGNDQNSHNSHQKSNEDQKNENPKKDNHKNYNTNEMVWALCLRGRNGPHSYSRVDESKAQALIPFAFKSIAAAASPETNIPQSEDIEERLTVLLEVAEALSGVLDIEKLIPTIMDRACFILNAERCSLFLVDNLKQELVTSFQAGLSQSIRMPLNRGIAGHSATTGEVINIKDAYEDSRFDRSVDTSTGFRTVSLLSVPILNNRGEITGVTEMINKKGGSFTDDDVRMMMAFNVFCGTSLDNAKLYSASIDLTRQLKTFMEMSSQMNKTKTLKEVMEGILTNAQSIVSATRATMFIYDNNDHSLINFASVGDKTSYGPAFARQTVAERATHVYDPNEVNELAGAVSIDRVLRSLDNEENDYGKLSSRSTKDNSEGSRKLTKNSSASSSRKLSKNNEATDSMRASQALVSREITGKRAEEREGSIIHALNASNTINSNKNTSSLSSYNSLNVNSGISGTNTKNEFRGYVVCIPLMNSEQTILGVMELQCPWKVVSEDIKLLDCFAVFAAVSLERSQFKDIATIGKTELELKKWVLPDERQKTDAIPSALQIPQAELKEIWTINFDSPMWDGIGHIRVLFNILYRFKIPQTYKIPNEKLYNFISEIRDTYKKVPYHNWRHAVDVTQFVTYQLLIGEYDTVFTTFELFALMVAAICHDANHDGFSNVFNVKAETPLGILYKNQSVMETHHCTVTIAAMSKEECNLFSDFNPDEYKQIWTLIISLILSTDMAKHFGIVKQFNDLYDNKEFSLEKKDHRLLLMQLLLKCGDISNVSRPFALADKWCDVLCEEFFRQGDLEMASGMEYTSPLNDRSHLDKPKSQIGFYTFVCLPLFQAAAKAIPQLSINVQQIESNLSVWKAETQNE